AVVDPLGKIAPQRLAAGLEVLDLLAVLGRTVEGSLRDLLVGDGDAEAGAEVLELVVVELLLLVSDVATFARLAEAVAFDGFRQDHRGLAFGLPGGLEGG